MGRPLRAKYSGSTSIGVQEMTDADIQARIAQLVLTYVINNPTPPNGLTLRLTPSSNPSYDVIRGTVYDTRTNGPEGTHPATTSNISTYNLYDWDIAPASKPTPFNLTARPVHYVSSGGESRIEEMTDQEIIDYIMPAVVSYASNGDLGSYYIGATSPAGTWTNLGTLVDTYYSGSTLINSSVYLWQRTASSTGIVAGAVRPLKLDGGNVKEMSDAEVEQLWQAIGFYISNNEIGQYRLQTTAPATGTWVARGSFVDTVNDTSSVGYAGTTYGTSFTSSYTGAYTGAFSGQYNQAFARVFTGAYSGVYSNAFTGAFSGAYVNTFTGAFTGNYSGGYVGSFTGAYTGAFTGTFSGAYANSFTGTFSGTYNDSFSGAYNRGFSSFYISYYNVFYSQSFTNTFQASSFSGAYTDPFVPSVVYTGLYTLSFSGTPYTGIYSSQNEFGEVFYFSGSYSAKYVAAFTRAFTGSFTGEVPNFYAGTYTRAFTGSYTGSFTGAYNQSFTRLFTGAYNQAFSNQFTGVYNQTFTGAYSGAYNQAFSGSFTGTYNQAFTGAFSGTQLESYTGAFTAAYTGTYSRTFTGAYNSSFSLSFTATFTGLTVLNTTSTTTYTLWCRVA